MIRLHTPFDERGPLDQHTAATSSVVGWTRLLIPPPNLPVIDISILSGAFPVSGWERSPDIGQSFIRPSALKTLHTICLYQKPTTGLEPVTR